MTITDQIIAFTVLSLGAAIFIGALFYLFEIKPKHEKK